MSVPPPEISFNYLGRFDVPSDDLFSFSSESVGRLCGDALERNQVLEIEGVMLGGRLKLSVTYNRRLHRPDTAHRILEGFKKNLLEVIDHCRSKSAGESTPSDFRYRDMDLEEWDALLKEIGVPASAVEDVIPLSPMQEGMLYHSLADRESQAYFEQFTYRIRGELKTAGWSSRPRWFWNCSATSRNSAGNFKRNSVANSPRPWVSARSRRFAS